MAFLHRYLDVHILGVDFFVLLTFSTTVGDSTAPFIAENVCLLHAYVEEVFCL